MCPLINSSSSITNMGLDATRSLCPVLGAYMLLFHSLIKGISTNNGLLGKIEKYEQLSYADVI